MTSIIESNENYFIIDLTLEYEHWTGQERYAVISNLAQEYLEIKYSAELEKYQPYIYMSKQFLDVRQDFKRNDTKFEMRRMRTESIFGFEYSIEKHNEEISPVDFETELIENILLREALMTLTETERQRIVDYFIVGKTYAEIAEELGCSDTAIKKSVAIGIRKLSNFMKKI